MMIIRGKLVKSGVEGRQKKGLSMEKSFLFYAMRSLPCSQVPNSRVCRINVHYHIFSR